MCCYIYIKKKKKKKNPHKHIHICKWTSYNESTTRSLALILTDLVLLYKIYEIWNLSPSSFAWTLPFNAVKWGGLCGREWYLMCACFLHMFFWRLGDILNDIKDMGRSPPPWLYCCALFLSSLPCWTLKNLRIILLNLCPPPPFFAMCWCSFYSGYGLGLSSKDVLGLLSKTMLFDRNLKEFLG